MRKPEVASPLTAVRPILVGTNHRDYNSIRNFSGLSSDAFVFKKTYDLLTLPRFLMGKVPVTVPDSVRRVFGMLHCDFGLFAVDVMHLFNAVSIGRRPWVVTFEHMVPLWNPRSRAGFRLLASFHCKRAIAMSNAALAIELDALGHYPEFGEAIRAKLIVLHPPQEPKLRTYSEKLVTPGPIEMTIVGHHFFRKGGREVLLVLDRLVEEGYDLQLNIVSRLERDTYAAVPTDDQVTETHRLIGRHASRIRLFRQLSKEGVEGLFRRSKLALLPTYADTYGYAVLEAQAWGCPVITTDIRALPEINNDLVGWVLPVPKDHLGNGRLDTRYDREVFSKRIYSGLYGTLKLIAAQPELLAQKGQAAVERIRTCHDPARHVDRLADIYRTALPDRID